MAAAVVRPLPFAELHIHLEGSLQPKLIWRFAHKNGIQFSFESLDALRAAYYPFNPNRFFDTYFVCGDVLRTEQDYEEAANEYLSKALTQGLRHIEMGFSPQLVTARGDDWRVAIRGLTRSLDNCEKHYGVTAYLIMEFSRTLPIEHAAQILEESIPYTKVNGGWIYCIGLYMETIPAIGFDQLYARARQLGLHCVAHAGHDDLGDVSDPGRFIVEAIDNLKVDRIDHGVQCIKDPELLKRLCGISPKIPINTCPVSNVMSGLFDSLSQHPLKKMLDLGLLVTCNSDDPAFFCCFKDTLDACVESLELSEDDLRRLAINSFEASFLPEEKKREFIQEVHAYHFVK